MSSKVPNAIKCSNCHHILNSPLILPCNHSICKKHLNESSNLSICCGKCEKVHSIPKSGFQPNETLAEVIESEINRLQNSDEANEASGRVDNEAILREIENSLKNPVSFIQEQIDELRNDVKVRGAQHKLKFDQGMKSLLAKLDEYEAKCKREFSIHKYSTDAQCLNDELKLVQEEINSWIKALNNFKMDEFQFRNFVSGNSEKIETMKFNLNSFKMRLFLNDFDKINNEIENFKKLNIESMLEYRYFDSTILNFNRLFALEKLLKRKLEINKNWTLLYRGSLHGFQAANFHAKCDGKTNTLTIVKSTYGNIFGGYTSVALNANDTYYKDQNAFLFSLVNSCDTPLIFEHNINVNNSIYGGSAYGPIFGSGHDLVINDNCNLNSNSYSKLGQTFIHPDYPQGSHKTNMILAGAEKFQVSEIEVFQKQ